jgi:hypothetical protein
LRRDHDFCSSYKSKRFKNFKPLSGYHRPGALNSKKKLYQGRLIMLGAGITCAIMLIMPVITAEESFPLKQRQAKLFTVSCGM